MNGFEIKRHGQRLTFELKKRAQFFVGVHNKAPSVAAMCVCNPDRHDAVIRVTMRLAT